MTTRSKAIGWAVALILLLLWRQFGPGLPQEVGIGDAALAKAFADQQRKLMVEFDGRILRELPSESDDDGFQRFLVQLDDGQVVVVDHDLSRADRIPLEDWDPISIRGEYNWDAQGGTVSWTHRDPGLGLKHGWIEYKGRRYD